MFSPHRRYHLRLYLSAQVIPLLSNRKKCFAHLNLKNYRLNCHTLREFSTIMKRRSFRGKRILTYFSSIYSCLAIIFNIFLFFSRQTGFSSASIWLLLNRSSQLSPLCDVWRRGLENSKTRPLYINMSTVSSDVTKQGRHWQPLSVHLWAYCNPPKAHDMNDAWCVKGRPCHRENFRSI